MSHFVLFAAIPYEEIGADFAASVYTELALRMDPYCETADKPEFLEFEPDPDGPDENEAGEPGYFFNPNAQWDWYSIGGRWPGMLWAAEDARDVLEDETSSGPSGDASEGASLPNGLRAVSGARIRDICWDAMLSQARTALSDQYRQLQRVLSGQEEPSRMIFVTKDGICGWGGDLLLKRGEALAEYLERRGAGPGEHLVPDMYAYLDLDGEWHSKGDMGWWGISSHDKPDSEWTAECRRFLETLRPDDVLVVVDCHI